MGLFQGSLLPLLFSFILGNDKVKYYTEVVEEGIKEATNFEYPVNAYSYKPREEQLHDFGTFDFIVVGAGATGCVVANRLTEVSDWKVLIVEAGDYGNDFADIPAMYDYVHASKYNWGFYSTPQTTACLGMIHHQCNYPRGKGVGGSTLINGLMYVRGNHWDYDHWAELGNKEWSYDRVLPYFKKAENFSRGNPKYHGHDGPVHVEYYPGPDSPQFTAFLKASEEVGQKILDYNGMKQLGVAYIQLNNINGHRDDAGKAYIKPFLNRTNLHVQINSYVTKLVIDSESKTATGIHFTYKGKKYVANARKEVILSAGSIMSPVILMLSGIGPQKELKKFDITCIKDLPVGQNLVDHTASMTLNFEMDYEQPNRTVEQNVKEFLKGYGRYTLAANMQGIGFIRTPLAEVPQSVPDIELIISPSVTVNPLIQRFFHFTNETYQAVWGNIDQSRLFRVFVILLHPRSAGSVTLKSADPFEYPLIDAQYLSDPENKDIDTLYEGIQYVLSLLDTKAYKKWKARLVPADLPACRDHKLLSKDYWYCFLRQTSQNLYHPMSSNKMGHDIKKSVVDSQLKVHGIGKLRVADISVLPASVSGHTSAVGGMIGEVVSDFIKRDYSALQ